jgi:hypothetical protein
LSLRVLKPADSKGGDDNRLNPLSCRTCFGTPMLSVLHAGNPSCGVLKQVQDDFLFYNSSWVGTKQSRGHAYSLCKATRLPRYARNDIIFSNINLTACSKKRQTYSRNHLIAIGIVCLVLFPGRPWWFRQGRLKRKADIAPCLSQ